MEYVWNIHGICMEYVWNMHGVCMEYVWNMHGICMEYVWNMYGICTKYLWNMYGICMDMCGICIAYTNSPLGLDGEWVTIDGALRAARASRQSSIGSFEP
jgi:hypothetical protein